MPRVLHVSTYINALAQEHPQTYTHTHIPERTHICIRTFRFIASIFIFHFKMLSKYLNSFEHRRICGVFGNSQFRENAIWKRDAEATETSECESGRERRSKIGKRQQATASRNFAVLSKSVCFTSKHEQVRRSTDRDNDNERINAHRAPKKNYYRMRMTSTSHVERRIYRFKI